MPDIDDEMRALMDETHAMLAAGKMVPDAVPWFWERRRENEMTPEYLGRVLDEAGLPELAAQARLGHFDDFHAPAEYADGFELVRLVRDLRRAARETTDAAGHERLAAIENAVRRGEFDATRAESDRWAASKDGQETFGALLASAAKPGRNAPCPCGSGRKFKRCHGA